MGNLRAKLKRKWWLWSVALLVLLFVGSDLGLRFGAGLGTPVLYQSDAACGYLPVPDQNVRRFGSRNVINHFSQRSDNLPATKEAGHFRILLVGDSVTYGTTFVDQRDIFASILARELPKQLHRTVDVMNAAVGAWAVGNEVGYLQSRGTFDADLVLFVLNTGDLNQPFNPGELSPTSGYPDAPPLCAWSELWVRYLRPRLFHQVAARDAGSTATTQDSAGDVQHVLTSLDRARILCSDAKARMAIVYSPCVGEQWQQAPYPESLSSLQKWTQKVGVPFLNLQSAYAHDPAAQVYWDGVHLRPQGNRDAADAIEQWLGTWVDPPSATAP